MTRFERWTVWVSAVATGATGLGFMWAKYLVTPAEPWSVVNHPLEPWFLKTHIVFAPVFVFAVGLIVTRHILPHIRRKVDRGRRSGLAMVWMLLPMAASGYLIQVVTAPALVTGLVVMHIATGVVFLLGLGGHGVALLRRAPGSRAAHGRRQRAYTGELRRITKPAASARRGPGHPEWEGPS